MHLYSLGWGGGGLPRQCTGNSTPFPSTRNKLQLLLALLKEEGLRPNWEVGPGGGGGWQLAVTDAAVAEEANEILFNVAIPRKRVRELRAVRFHRATEDAVREDQGLPTSAVWVCQQTWVLSNPAQSGWSRNATCSPYLQHQTLACGRPGRAEKNHAPREAIQATEESLRRRCVHAS